MSPPQTLLLLKKDAEGRERAKPTGNVWANMVRRRKSITHKRYRGPAWKGVGPNAGGLVEHPGRKHGEVVGSWIDGLTARRKVIVLCSGCMSKFHYKRVQYHKDERFGQTATGTCDGCRDYTTKGRVFLPEESLVQASGHALPGQCWIPK